MNLRRDKVLEKGGYDYGVLIKLWNLEVDYGSINADELEIKALKDYIEDVIVNEFAGNSGMISKEVKHSVKELADDLRQFLTELSKYHNSYYDVMWEGMSKIKDDYSLIVITIPIVVFMWD